jgi:hypothetical protein
LYVVKCVLPHVVVVRLAEIFISTF